MITKELLEKVNNGILTADAINGQTTEDEALIEEVIRIFSQVKTLIKEQPPESDFTTLTRKRCSGKTYDISQSEVDWLFEQLFKLCDRLDASEAEVKKYIEMDKYKSQQSILATENYNRICKQVEKLEASRKELREELKMIIDLLCHPGCFVNAKDIDRANAIIKANEQGD